MKSKPLEKSVSDYVTSLEKVLEKRQIWKEQTRPQLREALGRICTRFEIGWKVQELDWLWNNKAVNLMFDTVPKILQEKAGGMKDFDFVKGTALVFSQKYNGDISVLILYPEVGDPSSDSDFKELGTFHPDKINEEFVEEKVSDFLEEIMVWEESIMRHRVGF